MIRIHRSLAKLLGAAVLAFGCLGGATAAPNLNGLVGLLDTVPEGSWVRANLNEYNDVWAPPELRPLNLASNPSPEKIIIAWSSFDWDSKRGDLILYGGGHANYSGNDVYRWRGTTRLWERASLPSQIVLTPNGFHTAIDGVDNAPASAHTYDNSLYLPIIDRFLTFGGASYNTGNPYARPLTSSTAWFTGPYLFDPSKADGNKVGGSTGSHVQREGAFPEIVGGNMWTNRDVHKGTVIGTPPHSHINGMTAYAEENGKDVIYVGARPGQGTDLNLYRYTISALNDISQDKWEQVGLYWFGPTDIGAGAYDPVRKIFVRTGPWPQPITYWNLHLAAPNNKDAVAVPVDLSGGLNPSLRSAGIDYDPVRGGFMVWLGGGDVWKLTAPTPLATTGWTMRKVGVPIGAMPTSDTGTGILGKFKYIAQIDAYIALQDPVAGNVWLYKPVRWQRPATTNSPPLVNITSPSSGASFVQGTSVTVTAAASDSDGNVTKVDFYRNGVFASSSNGPSYSTSIGGLSVGNHVLTAVATDNAAATTTSAGVSITITAPPTNTPPTVAIQTPATGTSFAAGSSVSVTATAADRDGTIASVAMYIDGSLFATVSGASGPYTAIASGLPAGTHVLTAVAIDNAGARTTSAGVTIIINPALGSATLTLQNGLAGYSGAHDTHLSAWYKTENNGNSAVLYESGAYVDLLRFAVFQSEGGPVPNGTTITSATLSLYKLSDYNFTYEARRMLVDWVEGEATWNRPRIGATWAVAGAGGAGSDYATTADATASVGYAPGWLNFNVTAGVQAMSQGSTNFGWRLRGLTGNNNEKRFASTENASQALRPKLVVTYPTSTTLTATLQDGLSGYTGTRDNHLSAWYKTENNGSAAVLYESGAYVDLLRFAVFQSEGGPVPKGATITSATLSLYKLSDYNFTYEARRMLVDWVEGEATWNRPRIGATWAVAGAGGAGSDYATTVDATASVGYAPGWLDFNVTAGVQAMSQGSANFGWRLRGVTGNNNEKRFASRNNGWQALRPKLVVTYTVGGQ
jgi:hypothetical protein